MALQLHYFPGNASLIPHILLRELGLPFQLVYVDRSVQAHKSPEYLQLNPNGLIPVLVDGEEVIYETAAICLHLAQRHALVHPEATLIPPQATAQRTHLYKWLMWLTNSLQASLIIYFYPERWVDVGHVEAAEEVRRHAQARVVDLLQQLDDELARHPGPWFMGEQYTLLDPYVFVLCRWTRGFKSRPARDFARLGPYLQAMMDRPAVAHAMQAEQLPAPWV